MNDETKEWIDNASYEELLSRLRFAPPGDMLFQGRTGSYYFEVMKKKSISVYEHIAISKRMGWRTCAKRTRGIK